jgi:hypothetical protein
VAVIIYVPFEDEDLIAGAGHFALPTPAGKPKMPKLSVVLRGAGPAALSKLAGSDILYVIAHGRYGKGSEIVGIVKGRIFGTRKATMTAAALANALVDDGLSSAFGDVRLIVCWGGYVGGNVTTGGHELRRKNTEAPFAGQLCSALKGKGFKRIQVTGYNGAVSYSGKGSNATLTSVISNLADTETKEKFGAAMKLSADPLREDPHRKSFGTLSTEGRTVWI